MKNICLFILLLLSIVAKSQLPSTPGTQQRSLPANRPEDYNLFIRDQLGIPRFTDTAQANTNTTLDTCGRIIYTYSADAFWIRACYPVKHWIQGTGSIVNIFNNSITTTTVINDSSVQICTGAGACDTITFQTFITNVSSTYFIDSTHLVICGQDTTTFENVCDTLTIPQQKLYIFQNGTREVSAGLVEFGTNPLVHPTTLDTKLFIQTLQGNPVYDYAYQFNARQSFENGTAATSFIHKGSLDPLAPDFINSVRLGVNYTSSIYNSAPDLPGYMNDKIGYWLGVNGQGHGAFGIYIDNPASKVGGIFFHTLDTTYTDMVTIFGKHPLTANSAIGITAGNTGFAPYRIATFRDNKDMTFWGYPNTRDDGTMTKTLGTNSTGDVILGTPLIPVQNLTGGNNGDIIRNINNVWTPLPDSVRLDTVYTQNWVAVGRGLTRDTIEVGRRERDSSLLSYHTFLGMNSLSVTFNQGANDLFKISSDGTNGIVSLPAHARFETGQGVSITAANNLTLGGDGNVFTITGNTQINAITTANWQAGSQVELIFTGTPTVKNNTAGGAGTATILLSGNVDFAAAANDVLSLVYDGTNWHETARKTASGQNWESTLNLQLTPFNAVHVVDLGDHPFELVNGNHINFTVATGTSTEADVNIYSGFVGLGNFSGGNLTNIQIDDVAQTIILGSYGSGTHTGTPTYNLSVDASGNIIETTGETLQQVFNTEVGGSVITKDDSIQASTFSIKVFGENGAGLIQAISTGASSVGIYGSSVNSVGVWGNSTNNVGVYANSDNGNGIEATAGAVAVNASSTSSAGPVGNFALNASSTNTVLPVLQLNRSTTGTAANGIGGSIDFFNKTTSGTVVSNRLISKWTDATSATRTSQFIVTGINSAIAGNVLVISGDGATQMPKYGAGAATFDASGNITSVSDVRLKDIQGDYNGGLNELMNVTPIIYKWNEKSGMEREHNYIGFSAQNIQSALGNDAIGINRDGYLSIQDRAILATLVNAIKEQQKEIDDLKRIISER